MRLGTRVWSIGKVLLLVGALGATFLVFFYLSMRVAMRAGQVKVPELRGRSVSDATQLLAELELGLRVDANPRPDQKVPVGGIAMQDPPAGVDVRPQRTIRVWVSSGPRTTKVPRLVGQGARTYQLGLDQEGLTATISEFRSADYQADTVVAQVPPPESTAPQVSLLLNRGAEAATYVMPDVIGMDGTRVEALLRSRGFRVTIVGSRPIEGIPAGTIVRQQPAAGFQVGPADAISLEVAR
jgi:serine/threonine-protein kinase